jgi:hypothetical protein
LSFKSKKFYIGELVIFEEKNIGIIIDIRDNPADTTWRPSNICEEDMWPRKVIDLYYNGELSTVWMSHAPLNKCE